MFPRGLHWKISSDTTRGCSFPVQINKMETQMKLSNFDLPIHGVVLVLTTKTGDSKIKRLTWEWYLHISKNTAFRWNCGAAHSIAHSLCLQFYKQLHKAFVHKPNMSPPLPYLLQYLRIFFNSVFIIWSKLKDENFGDIINCINIEYVNTLQQI